MYAALYMNPLSLDVCEDETGLPAGYTPPVSSLSKNVEFSVARGRIPQD